MYRRLAVRHSARAQFGEVCEWLKQQVSKTCKPQGFEGSNPSLSVELKTPLSAGFLLVNFLSIVNVRFFLLYQLIL